MTGDTWTTSPETTSGSPDSFDDIGGALDNERTPERVMQAMQDEGLGPEFSIPRGESPALRSHRVPFTVSPTVSPSPSLPLSFAPCLPHRLSLTVS